MDYLFPVSGLELNVLMPPVVALVLGFFSSMGLGGTLLPGVIWAQAQDQAITKEVIADAEAIARHLDAHI